MPLRVCLHAVSAVKRRLTGVFCVRSKPRRILRAPSDNSDGAKGSNEARSKVSDEVPSGNSSPQAALKRSQSTLQRVKSFASFKQPSFFKRKGKADEDQPEEIKPQLHLAGYVVPWCA
jgi:hypothetical protein